MTWNYRVVSKTQDGETLYAIHEAFYEGKNTKPHSITQQPVQVVGETIDELRQDYIALAEAFQKPVLKYEDF